MVAASAAGCKIRVCHQRSIAAGYLAGNEVDIAHMLISLTQGLAAAEAAERLGTTQESVDRRWRLATEGLLRGLRGAG